MVQLKLTRLVKSLAYDVGLKLSDAEYLVRRVKSEGLRFLTVTLPALESAVLLSLEKGKFERPTSIIWHRGSLGRFRVLLDHIFDPNTGKVVESESTAIALKKLRQLCSYFYKLAVKFDDSQISRAVDKYLIMEYTEVQTLNYDKKFVDRMRKHLHTQFREFTDASLSFIFSAVAHTRFGPGSFFGSLEKRTPYYAYKGMPEEIVGTCSDKLQDSASFFRSPVPRRYRVPVNTVKEDRVCEVLFVPKDSRGPRVISKEQLHTLRAQLAYFDWSTALLSKSTGGCIQFKEQTGNQELARAASITREFVTADLSSASDRVSFKVCRQLFENTRGVRELILKHRSTEAIIAYPPDEHGHVIKTRVNLGKLAGMGSGLTFPTMALLIYLAAYTEVHLHCPTIGPNEFRKGFRVYGDDVIILSEWYDYLRSALKRVGLQLNEKKTFVSSHFRESCGADYYNGCNVTPVRLKLSSADLPESKSISTSIYIDNDEGILQLERHARELVCAGMHRTTEYIYSSLESSLGKLPTVTGSSPVLGRYSINPVYNEPFKFAYVPRAVHTTSADSCPVKALGQWLWKHTSEGVKYNLRSEMPFQREVAGRSLKDHTDMSVPRRTALKRIEVHDPAIFHNDGLVDPECIRAQLAASIRRCKPSRIDANDAVAASIYAVAHFSMSLL